MDLQCDRGLMDNLDKRRLQVMDLFRVLINERPSKLFLIDQNCEEVHTRLYLNELQKEYCMKTKVIALD